MVASVYWQGNRVAAGRKFDPDAMTVAHRSLPFGTRLLVYYGSNAAEVVVNDSGPFVHGRDIDLSRGVAKRCISRVSAQCGRCSGRRCRWSGR